MHISGNVRSNLLAREDLTGKWGRPRPITQRVGAAITPGGCHVTASQKSFYVAQGCGAVRGYLDLHWMGHSRT